MSIEQFEKENNINLVPKSESWLMRAVGWVLEKTRITKSFSTIFWTTFRLPFQKPTISYPSKVTNPLKYKGTLEHEMIHAEDMRSAWGLFKMFWLVWLLPLPVFFSGRWFIERHAYLNDILKHGRSIDVSVDMLWRYYAWAWPKSLMKKWFEEQVAKHKEESNEDNTKNT